MAVAGFAEDELNVTAKENSLVISGKKEKPEDDKASVLHRGIASRAFERRFDLADHIKVTGAKLENGLLAVALVREIPEAMKPRSIRSEEHTSELQSLMRISYAVFCLKKKKTRTIM